MKLFANRQDKKTLSAAARVPAALVVIILNLSALAAATLPDYQARLQTAEAAARDLAGYMRSVPVKSKGDAEYENTAATEIGKGIPASEKVDWKGVTAETGNQWLHDGIAEFRGANDRVKRLAILSGIRERLSAVLEKVNELEKAPSSDRTKDEDKQKLAEILGREEYRQIDQKEESLFQKWTREFMDWLAKMFPRVNMPASSGGGFQGLSIILQVLLYALVLGAIGFVIYKFAPFLFGRFATRVKTKKKDRVILGERISEEESAESLFGEAERLAREGDLRGAIRKGYIALLCELSDKKIIGLAQHKTNRDYLRDVRNRGELYQNVSGLTNSFELHWYGFRSADINDWDEFRQNFRRAISSS